VADDDGRQRERYHDPGGCPEVDGGDDHEPVEQGDQGEPEVVNVCGLAFVGTGPCVCRMLPAASSTTLRWASRAASYARL
jgi:hypothetical protein